MALVMGIDCGTTGIRVVLYDDDGNQRSFGSEHFATNRTRRGWSEQDPLDWWNGLNNSISMALKGISASEIKVIGITATGPTAVFADEFGYPVRPSIMWDDTRAIECVENLNMSYESLVAKALWVSKFEKEQFQAAATICDATDWLIWRLTGERAIDKYSYYSIPLHLEEIDLNVKESIHSKLPARQVEVGGVVGELLPSVAEALNLPKGIPVVNATRDALVASLSLGLTDRRSVGLIGGSSNLVLAMFDENVGDVKTAALHPSGTFHPKYSTLSGTHYSGIIWDWWKRLRGEAIREDLVKALAIPAGSDGIVFFEWFQGNRMPWKDPYLTGGMWGLSLHHEPSNVARSILESIAFGTRLIFEGISSIPGINDRQLRVTGGLANIPLYNEILASVLNRPLTVMQVSSGSAVGAAILAAKAVGMDQLTTMKHPSFTVEPNVKNIDVYNQCFSYYVETAQQMKGLMHRMTKDTNTRSFVDRN